MNSIVTTIADVRRDGKSRTARCPAHDDAHASLSIGMGQDGRVLLNCHAGCETPDVLAAANLTMADLAPDAQHTGRAKREIVATYDYTDEQGALLYQVVRYAPKDFQQRRPDGEGGWVWKTIGVRRVLFGLPELSGEKTVYIAEGEKDVLTLRSLGLIAATNCGGATKWRDDYTQQLRAAGVEAVIIIPDQDDAGRKHAKIVERSCRAGGLSATVVKLPDLDEHGDVTDWIAGGHTREDIENLVERAAMREDANASDLQAAGGQIDQINQRLSNGPTEPDDPPTLDPADPMSSARTFLERTYTAEGIITLRHQAGVFCGYDPELNSYVDVEDAVIRARIYAFLDKALRWDPELNQLVPFKPTKAKVENFLDSLRALCVLPASSAAPCWLDTETVLDPLDIVPCRNGLLHVPTRELLPPTPHFFTRNGLDFAFDADAPTPVHFLRFLDDLWPDDRESQECLQECMGYLLTPRTHQQKIFMVVGPKRSGKGTIGRVMRRLFGERNVCGPTLASMGEQFGLWTLIGKTVAIISDARVGGRTDTAVVAERLLSISGEDALSVPRKFLPDWTGRLSARFVLMTNELPRVEDASGALSSRFVILALQKSFYGHEDLELFDRLVPELPAILNWVLLGHDRLRARGHFSQPTAAADLIRILEDLGSPTKAFVGDCCEIGRGYEVRLQTLFDAWRSWCLENGRDHPGNVQMFGRNLKAVVAGLGESSKRFFEKRIRYYEGIRLREGDEE